MYSCPRHTYINTTHALSPKRQQRHIKYSSESPRFIKIVLNTMIDRADTFWGCLLLFPTLIPLSGVGKTCFSSCCDKESAIIFTTGRLPDVNPPWNWSFSVKQLVPAVFAVINTHQSGFLNTFWGCSKKHLMSKGIHSVIAVNCIMFILSKLNFKGPTVCTLSVEPQSHRLRRVYGAPHNFTVADRQVLTQPIRGIDD
jgi:hypothetical protein